MADARFEELLGDQFTPQTTEPTQLPRYEELLEQPGVPELPPEIIIQSHNVAAPEMVKINPITNEVEEIATLVVDGVKFEDWETVWIQWNWTEDWANFKFTCAEREPYPEDAAVLQFAPGDDCEIYLGGILVIRGVIITRQVAYDANQHAVSLEGKSASWFAARSSIVDKKSDFNGKSFTQIAAAVLAPTGVGFHVIPVIDERPFESGASPSPGETISQFLERLARDRKIIVSSTPTGDYLFIGEHAWPSIGDLIEGINIKKMQCVITDITAYSEFITRGQKQAHDPSHGREAAEQEAIAKGKLTRYSVLLTAMEHPVMDAGEVARRNDFEKMWNQDTTIIEATVTVYGWFRPRPSWVASIAQMAGVYGTSGHTLWMAGDEVVVHSPMAMLRNHPLKIKTVTWQQDNQGGTQTIMQLVNPAGLNSKTNIPVTSPGYTERDVSRPSSLAPVTPPPFDPNNPRGSATGTENVPGSLFNFPQ